MQQLLEGGYDRDFDGYVDGDGNGDDDDGAELLDGLRSDPLAVMHQPNVPL
jgi:hypothetical protein